MANKFVFKQQDLRIGNIIEFKGSEGWELEIVDPEDIHLCVFHHEYYNKQSRPVQVTEEILLKYGFEKQDYNMSNCHVYQKGIYRVLKSFNNDNINQDYSLCINGISPPTWSIAHFKYLHQLQNIYFALTNTELKEIK